jgi:hypothetical protein
MKCFCVALRAGETTAAAPVPKKKKKKKADPTAFHSNKARFAA